MSELERDSSDDPLDELDTSVVEDLDVDDEAGRVRGGTLVGTGGCPSMGCPVHQ